MEIYSRVETWGQMGGGSGEHQTWDLPSTSGNQGEQIPNRIAKMSVTQQFIHHKEYKEKENFNLVDLKINNSSSCFWTLFLWFKPNENISFSLPGVGWISVSATETLSPFVVKMGSFGCNCACDVVGTSN